MAGKFEFDYGIKIESEFECTPSETKCTTFKGCQEHTTIRV